MSEAISLYDVLGVTRDATDSDIKRGYRKIARECHPDITDDEARIQRFKDATEAYGVLMDPAKRVLYNRRFDPPKSVSQLMLGTDAGLHLISALLPKAPAEPRAGVSLGRVVTVPEEILRSGGEVTVTLPNPEGEPQEVLLSVAAHRTGHWCKFAQLGDPGKNGADAGNFIVILAPES